MKYEPIYIKEYLKSFPTLSQIWADNDAHLRHLPPMTKDEKRHLSTLIDDYHECKDPNERITKRDKFWNFLAMHGLSNMVCSHGPLKGILDLDGNRILPAIYNRFCITYDNIERMLPVNYYACQKDGKWGVVNRYNRTRIPFEYNRIFRLVNSPYLFYVETKGKKGVIKLTPYETDDGRDKNTLEHEETATTIIPCEMEEIYFIEHINLFVFRQTINGKNKFGWYWETSTPNPNSFSPCIHDELYIPSPPTEESTSYEDDFFEARRGKSMEYILIWTHRC